MRHCCWYAKLTLAFYLWTFLSPFTPCFLHSSWFSCNLATISIDPLLVYATHAKIPLNANIYPCNLVCMCVRMCVFMRRNPCIWTFLPSPLALFVTKTTTDLFTISLRVVVVFFLYQLLLWQAFLILHQQSAPLLPFDICCSFCHFLLLSFHFYFLCSLLQYFVLLCVSFFLNCICSRFSHTRRRVSIIVFVLVLSALQNGLFRFCFFLCNPRT